MMQKMKAPSLPFELVTYIARFIDDVQSWINFCLICKRFRRLLQEDNLFAQLFCETSYTYSISNYNHDHLSVSEVTKFPDFESPGDITMRFMRERSFTVVLNEAPEILADSSLTPDNNPDVVKLTIHSAAHDKFAGINQALLMLQRGKIMRVEEGWYKNMPFGMIRDGPSRTYVAHRTEEKTVKELIRSFRSFNVNSKPENPYLCINETMYAHGKKEGLQTQWNPNSGDIIMQVRHRGDVNDGFLSRWEDGIRVQEYIYERNKPIAQTKWDKDTGIRIEENKFIDGKAWVGTKTRWDGRTGKSIGPPNQPFGQSEQQQNQNKAGLQLQRGCALELQ